MSLRVLHDERATEQGLWLEQMYGAEFALTKAFSLAVARDRSTCKTRASQST